MRRRRRGQGGAHGDGREDAGEHRRDLGASGLDAAGAAHEGLGTQVVLVGSLLREDGALGGGELGVEEVGGVGGVGGVWHIRRRAWGGVRPGTGPR